MTDAQANNPLHGVTLKAILEDLLERHGWEGLAARIPVACFKSEPSLKSSLNFLRKTEWARAKVEKLYLDDQRYKARRQRQNKRRAEKRIHRRATDPEAQS